MKTLQFITGIILMSAACIRAEAGNLSCQIDPMFGSVENKTVSLNGSISVGDDVPVGTVLYSAQANTNRPSLVSCVSDTEPTGNMYYFVEEFKYKNLPNSPAPGVYLSPGEIVYQTNLPGIGVVLQQYLNKPLPNKVDNSLYFIDNTGKSTGGVSTNVIIKLVKTGPVSPGVVNGASLPTFAKTIYPPVSNVTGVTFSGFPINADEFQFSGNLNVIASTCELKSSNIDVYLGEYLTTKFNGVGTVTNWKDATISLTGCTSFKEGYYSNDNRTIITSSNTFPTGNTDVNNKVSVTLSPVGTMFDSNNGIINLKDSSDSASGVAIQLGIENGSDVSPVKLLTPVDVGVPVAETNTLNIPIKARYIQTEDFVTPGKADGSVVFTINYH